MPEDQTIEARVIPNPNTGQFMLAVEQTGPNAEARLFDLSGRLVTSRIIGVTVEESMIEFSGISNGVYLLHIVDGERREVVKVFVR
jgi:hypothetical protein